MDIKGDSDDGAQFFELLSEIGAAPSQSVADWPASEPGPAGGTDADLAHAAVLVESPHIQPLNAPRDLEPRIALMRADKAGTRIRVDPRDLESAKKAWWF
jgi:hypothetical protein